MKNEFETNQLELIDRTWHALQQMALDPNCSTSIARYEKLAKIHLALTRHVSRQAEKAEAKNPTATNDDLELEL